MISEEEKEAIDYFTKDKDYFNEQIKIIEMMDTDYYDEELNLYKKRAKHYQIILNLISKLQKENDKLQKVINLMAEDRAELSKDSVVPTCKEAIIDFYFKQVEDKNEKK